MSVLVECEQRRIAPLPIGNFRSDIYLITNSHEPRILPLNQWVCCPYVVAGALSIEFHEFIEHKYMECGSAVVIVIVVSIIQILFNTMNITLLAVRIILSKLLATV